MARLKIDIRAGMLEVEGDEPFIREIYGDFKNRLNGPGNGAPGNGESSVTEEQERDAEEPLKQVEEPPKRRQRSSGGGAKESYALNKHLNLFGKDGKAPLKKFYDEKKPDTAVQRNALFVYYLKNVIGHSPVTLDDIYTCYSEVKVKAPDAFRQSIKDTSGSRYGYIDAKNMDDIQIPLRGTQFVEHDLPPKSRPGENK